MYLDAGARPARRWTEHSPSTARMLADDRPVSRLMNDTRDLRIVTVCFRRRATGVSTYSIDITAGQKRLAGQHGTMVSSCASRIAAVPLERVVGRTKLVPPDSDTVRSARAAGIEFGG